MEARLDYIKENPDAYKAMLGMEEFVRNSGLDHKLLELIKIRASQINGCAFCLDMHTKDARAIGETEQRIYLLNAWRESPFYSDAERVALELTECVTRISENGVPDEIYEKVRKHFDAKQYIALVMAINTINSWNRLSIANATVPGSYQPATSK